MRRRDRVFEDHRDGGQRAFSEWGQTFTDRRLAAAVVDRLTFRAHIIETGSESYRLRVTSAAMGGAPTS